MLLRQFPAASWRSAALIGNCTSFSACSNVAGETGGPTSGEVPNAGGAPGGRDAGSGDGLRHAIAVVMRAAEAPVINWRRDFGMVSSNHIAAKPEYPCAKSEGPNGPRIVYTVMRWILVLAAVSAPLFAGSKDQLPC